MRRVHETSVAVQKKYILHILCVCVCVCVSVALVIQHAKPMRRIVLSSVVSLAAPYFPTLSHKHNDFRKKGIEQKMCVLIFCTTFVRNICHSEKNPARYC